MVNQFCATPADSDVLTELSAVAPANPFATAEYSEARRTLGYQPWVLGLRNDEGTLADGCGGFFRSGRLNRILEIVSLPALGASSPFWDGLREFCEHHGVTRLQLGTFASPPGTAIPNLSNHFTQRVRCEFVLDLLQDPTGSLHSNHKRNVKKARKAGVVVVRTQSVEAASAHVALMTRSRDRRHGRGKSPGHTGQPTGHAALLRSGAAEVFQALLDGSAVSSVLVLRAPQGAYYHSAGTSPEGMAVGASHFLVQAIATELRAERVAVFNLGGADEDSGLGRFKAGFGCQRVPLPQATFFVGPAWRRRAGKLATLVRSAGKTALHPLASGTLLRSR